jgi:mannose-6-phosphate isomerase-like protein (cupin superfamily)
MSRKPYKVAVNSLALEPAHGGEGMRRLILKQSDDISPNIEAFANTFLEPGGQFSWHKHEQHDEIMVCLAGRGSIKFDTGEEFSFGERDTVYIPKGIEHTILSPEVPTEYFFFRVI